MTQPRFWMVLGDNTPYTNMRHPSATSARKEAQRLAESNPSTKFYVLEAKGYMLSMSTHWHTLQKEQDDVE